MKGFLVILLVISTAFAFGPDKVKHIAKKLTPPIDCNGRPTPFTISFCEYRPHRLFKHPSHPKWFIDCFSKTCQRCGPHNVLELNEDCQMCLGPGAKCPKPQPKPMEMPCPNDGCPFCPDNVDNGGYTYHQDPQFFCQCVWGSPHCMPCPCEQVFDRKKKCCVPNKTEGKKCPSYY